jgi:deoxyxylulose-5-phosphate synthase
VQFDLKSSIFDNRLLENTDLTMCSSTQEPTSFNGTRGINLARQACGPDNRRVVERGNRSLTVSAAAIRDQDPVDIFEHKGLFAHKREVPDGELVDTLGTARIVREGTDVTVIALAAMVHTAAEAADHLGGLGISAEVVDLRSLVPLDTQTILGSVAKTTRLATVEEDPRLVGWGAEIASIVA